MPINSWRTSQGIEEVSAAETVRSRTAYWALVDRMDQLIGQMLEAMRTNGLARDTLVVYTSVRTTPLSPRTQTHSTAHAFGDHSLPLACLWLAFGLPLACLWLAFGLPLVACLRIMTCGPPVAAQDHGEQAGEHGLWWKQVRDVL